MAHTEGRSPSLNGGGTVYSDTMWRLGDGSHRGQVAKHERWWD